MAVSLKNAECGVHCSRILIGQLKRKPSESCPKGQKVFQVAKVGHVVLYSIIVNGLNPGVSVVRVV